MMASRAIGYFLLAILVGAVLISFVILGVQWVKEENDRQATPSPKAGYLIFENEPAQIAYQPLPSLLAEV